MKQPLIIAHRGASAHAPENTLSAFELAIREKADGIEMDVWLCASGEAVVTHNRNVAILTGRAGNLEKMTLRQLKALDFGGFKATQFYREKIPTLEEVLDLAKNMELINIEIKGVQVRSNGIELAVAEAIMKFNLLRRVIVSSFNPAALLRIQSLNPAIKTGLLFYEKSPMALRQAWSTKLVDPYSLHPSYSLLKKTMIQKAQEKKHKIFTWTINYPEQVDHCVKLGVDGMITDDPGWMRKLLENSTMEEE